MIIGRIKEFAKTISPDRAWLVAGMLVSFALFMTTVQTTINGSDSPYTNDTGEIQNVLPRWGTLHWTGYPQYSIIGSLLVTILRKVGIPPAAGASIVSALWAIIAVGFVIQLACELGTPIKIAVLGGWFLAVSTSFWMDASIAEVHTMTVAVTLATLYYSLRFGRGGQRLDLFWLVLLFSQGIVHQRAVVFIAPAVGLLIFPKWKKVLSNLKSSTGIALLAPLTYLYLPFCVMLGVDINWTFGQIASVKGLLGMLLDNRADRVVQLPADLTGWIDRLGVVFNIMNDDMAWPFLVAGLSGLALLVWSQSRREAIALTLSWVPYMGLALVIWVGHVGDAVLAAKLPVLPMAALGLGITMGRIGQRLDKFGLSVLKLFGILGILMVLFIMVLSTFPEIIAVTRDQSAEKVISIVDMVTPPEEEKSVVVMALWGNDFWALAYAQAFENRLPGVRLVDHNANFNSLLQEGKNLWVLSQVFYLRPLSWWDQHLEKPAVLSSIAPGVIQVSEEKNIFIEQEPAFYKMDMGNGIHIVSTKLEWVKEYLALEVVWQAAKSIDRDYSVAVHLVSNDPPTGAHDILSQSDSAHPVEGWYPTSRWSLNQVIYDHYLVFVPENSKPEAIRVALYYQQEEGTFTNSPWLSVPVKQSESAW